MTVVIDSLSSKPESFVSRTASEFPSTFEVLFEISSSLLSGRNPLIVSELFELTSAAYAVEDEPYIKNPSIHDARPNDNFLNP